MRAIPHAIPPPYKPNCAKKSAFESRFGGSEKSMRSPTIGCIIVMAGVGGSLVVV